MSLAQRASKVAQGRGALFSLAVLFLLSGALRLIDGAATAASNGDMKTQELATEDQPMRDDYDPATLADAMQELRAREERLTEAENALADRMSALTIAETTIRQKLVDLAEAEERLLATMARTQSAAEEDVERLTSVYENMKPKEATEVFARMEPEFAAGFLGRMRADAAALILAGLEPEKAYSISVILAGRNARAPTE